MDTTWWIVIAVVAALVVLALLAWGYMQSRRRTALKDQFGPEYDRTVSSAGSRRSSSRRLRIGEISAPKGRARPRRS